MKYIKPEMELIVFEQQDVVRTSGLGNGGSGTDYEDTFQ